MVDFSRGEPKAILDSLKPLYIEFADEKIKMREFFHKIIESIKDYNVIKENHDEISIWDELWEHFSWYYKFPEMKDKIDDEIIKLAEHLIIKRKYVAYLILEKFPPLPEEYNIGITEIIQPDGSRTEVLEYIDTLVKEGVLSEGEWQWLKVEFECTNSLIHTHKKLFEILEVPIGYLSMITHRDIDITELPGIIYAEDGSYSYKRTKMDLGNEGFFKKGIDDDFTSIINDILKKIPKSRSEIEKKIIQSLQMYFQSTSSHRTETRYLLTISALESLLLSGGDKDYIGLKIAEKTSFILHNHEETRIECYRYMKKCYKKRSLLVHQGNNEITREDLSDIENIFKGVFYRMLFLSKRYKKIGLKDNDSDEDGLEDLLCQMKFKT